MNLSDESARQAALDMHHSVIVQAPAGSGKTEILCRRFLTALATVDQPEQVIAITFTRKAANEMRERILRYLHDPENPLAQKVLEQDQQKSWKLLSHPERLSLMTIDSLCAKIMDQAPIPSSLYGFSMTESPVVLYQQAVAAMLSEADERHPWQNALHALLLHCDNRWSKLQSLLVDMLAKREQWLMLLPEANDPHLWRERLENNLQACIQEAVLAVKNILPEALCEIFIELMAFAGFDLAEDFYVSLPKFVLTQSGALRKMVDKRCGFPLGEGDEKAYFKAQKQKMLDALAALADIPGMVEALQYLAKIPSPTYTEAEWQRVLEILQVLRALLAYWQLTIQQTKEIDFTEVALKALLALGPETEPTELALAMDYRLKHLLVDEFQDTSLLQYHLLEKLTQTWEEGDGRTLFLVGDPLQSIYRFRQAEVGLFLRVWEKGFGPLRLLPIQLTQNFRSSPALVNFYNEALSSVLPKVSSMQEGAVAYVPVLTMGDPAHRQAIFKKTDAALLEQDAILIDELKKFHTEHPQEKAAILVRSRTHLATLFPKLHQENIPYQARDLSRLSDQPVVIDLLSWLKALLNLEDRLSWLAVLHAPWCGLPLSLIQQMFEKDQTLVWPRLLQAKQDLFQQENRALIEFISLWQEALSARQKKPLDQLLYEVWEISGAKRYWLDEASLQAEKQFFRCLQQFQEAGDLPSLSQFEHQLQRSAFTPRYLETPWLEIMTIHKAKGLEFDAVFLPSLEKVGQHEDHPLLVFDEIILASGPKFLLAPMREAGEEDPIFSFIWYLQKTKAYHERLRLLYVACTRAKKSLYLFAEALEKPREGSFLSGLVMPA